MLVCQAAAPLQIFTRICEGKEYRKERHIEKLNYSVELFGFNRIEKINALKINAIQAQYNRKNTMNQKGNNSNKHKRHRILLLHGQNTRE